MRCCYCARRGVPATGRVLAATIGFGAMTRRSMILAVAGVLMLPATAPAAERTELRGTLPQASVEFQAVSVNGDIVKVNKFKFSDVALACDEGVVIVSRARPLPAMKVNKRNRTVDGVRYGNCDSDKVKWAT